MSCLNQLGIKPYYNRCHPLSERAQFIPSVSLALINALKAISVTANQDKVDIFYTSV